MLTDTVLRNLKPKPRLYRMTDAYGLEIDITAKGSELWRVDIYPNLTD